MPCGHESVRMTCCALGKSVSTDADLGTAYVGGTCCADRLAVQAASELRFEVWAFPAEWDQLGKRAGVVWNRRMLDEKPDLVLAFLPDLAKSKGAKDCVTEARRRGR